MKLLRSLMILAAGLGYSASADLPVEVGTVNWSRDHDAVPEKSKASGIPVFLLFHEVPGCAGCKDFGREVLSDPELVRMIEQSFLPLLVYNNRSGKDSELLKQYNEPSWNYQVIRFPDGDGNDIIPRKEITSSTSLKMPYMSGVKKQIPTSKMQMMTPKQIFLSKEEVIK